jgi:hypothetical protein
LPTPCEMEKWNFLIIMPLDKLHKISVGGRHPRAYSLKSSSCLANANKSNVALKGAFTRVTVFDVKRTYTLYSRETQANATTLIYSSGQGEFLERCCIHLCKRPLRSLPTDPTTNFVLCYHHHKTPMLHGWVFISSPSRITVPRPMNSPLFLSSFSLSLYLSIFLSLSLSFSLCLSSSFLPADTAAVLYFQETGADGDRKSIFIRP